MNDLSGNRLNDGSDIVVRFVVIKETYLYPYTNYGGGDGEAVGIGDFNHDGLTDVVMTTSSEMLVYLKGSDGNLKTPVAYAAGSYSRSLAVGDLNNDGWDDLVTVDFHSSKISVFLQQSDGTFAPRITYTTHYMYPTVVVVGDITGDGLADVVLSYSGSLYMSSVGVFAQNTNGSLDPVVTYDEFFQGGEDLAIGDVNHDGRNDVVKMNTVGSSPDLSVYLQNTSGTLSEPVPYFLDCNCRGSGIEIGDVTGDGLSDVVISYGGNRPDSKIAVFAQGQDGLLQPSVSYDAYDMPQPVELADIDRDGTLDILVLHGGWRSLGVFLQKNGAIQPSSLYTIPSTNAFQPQGLAAGDINQDGATDVAIADDNYGLTVLYYHEKPAPQVIMGGNASPVDGEELGTETSQLTVQFDRQMRNDAGASSANNPSNYLLVEDGVNGNFQTSSCAGGHAGDDVLISVDSVTYDTSKYFSTLSINGAVPLGAGSYRLLVCGTSSIEDVDGAKLNGGLSDTSITFTVWSTPHTISGNAGVPGAMLSYTDDGSRTVIADGIGDYSIKVSNNWTGTVTPSKANYTFDPASKTYTDVSSDLSNENYTATRDTLTISGNTGMGSVLLYYSAPGEYVSSDEYGNYSLTVPTGWSGIVYPESISGYRFIPAIRSYNNLQASQANQDFVPERVYTIYGNAGAAGVTLSYVDGTSKTVTSDSGGNYSIQVPEHWSGTITPSKSSHIFTPSSRTYTDIVANQLSQNYAATILVTNTNDSGPGSLRQAITDATPGSTIYFDPALTGQTIVLSSEIAINKRLTIDGTALDPRVSISGNHAVRIFNIGSNVSLTLRSLILKDGMMGGTSYTKYGGAIYTNSTVMVTDVDFVGNTAYQAGAIYVSSSASATILESRFSSNTAQVSGGAIYASNGLIIRNSVFTSNTAQSGGAVVLKAPGTYTLERNIFVSNHALGGGAIMLDQNQNFFVTVRNNLFSSNVADNLGGAIRIVYSGPEQIVIENNTFYANQSKDVGGAVATEGNVQLRNNTFSENRADRAGGNAGGSVYIASGGVFTYLFNNIFANNAGGGECYEYGPNSWTRGNNNLVEDGSGPCATLPGTIISDPMLGPLTDHGGPTQTMALLPGSPAIDTGNDANCPSTDQRGVARPQSTHCDVGAYELEATLQPPGAATLASPTGSIGIKTPTYIWQEVSGATWYYLWVNGPGSNVHKQWYTSAQANCNGSICSVTPMGLTLKSGNHTWWIQTWNDAGYGPWSAGMNFTVLPPGKATLVAPSGSIGNNNPTYTWNEVSGATYYYLWLDGPSGHILDKWYSSADANCTGGTCSVAGATPGLGGGTHTWWIQTWSNTGYGPWSDGMTFTPPAPTLPGKANLVSPSGTIVINNPAYTWNEVSGATYYYLWLDGPSGHVYDKWFTAAEAGCNGSTCSATLPSPLSAGAHIWWVQTWNPVGYGPWSDGKSFSVSPPVAATLVSPTGSVANNPTYTWNEVTGATWYYLWIDGPSGNVFQKWYTSEQASCNGSTCSVSGVTPGLGAGAHTWWIQTWSSAGYGPWSNGMSFSVSP
jgi:predicted outer membrane repeat protein